MHYTSRFAFPRAAAPPLCIYFYSNIEKTAASFFTVSLLIDAFPIVCFLILSFSLPLSLSHSLSPRNVCNECAYIICVYKNSNVHFSGIVTDDKIQQQQQRKHIQFLFPHVISFIAMHSATRNTKHKPKQNVWGNKKWTMHTIWVRDAFEA